MVLNINVIMTRTRNQVPASQSTFFVHEVNGLIERIDIIGSNVLLDTS